MTLKIMRYLNQQKANIRNPVTLYRTDWYADTFGYATTNECYNEQFVTIKSGSYN
jgi:hypothetical protein